MAPSTSRALDSLPLSVHRNRAAHTLGRQTPRCAGVCSHRSRYLVRTPTGTPCTAHHRPNFANDAALHHTNPRRYTPRDPLARSELSPAAVSKGTTYGLHHTSSGHTNDHVWAHLPALSIVGPHFAHAAWVLLLPLAYGTCCGRVSWHVLACAMCVRIHRTPRLRSSTPCVGPFRHPYPPPIASCEGLIASIWRWRVGQS